MLSQLHQSAKGFLAKIILGLLVISFVSWGIGDIVTGARPNAVALVGESSISVAEYGEAMQELKREFGEHYSPEMLKNFNLYQIKLNEMISHRLFAQEAARLDIGVGERTLLKIVGEEAAFKNATGHFDKGVFLQALQRLGMTEKQYFARLRESVAIEILVTTLAIRPPVPAALLDRLYAARYGQRNVTLAILPPQADAKAPTPDAARLKKFYAARKEAYRAPEYRSLRYIYVTPEDIYKKVRVTRDEAMESYRQRVSDFLEPERREVEQLLYETKEEAENAYGLLMSGKNFAAVAKAVPPANQDAVKLGFVFKDELPAGADEVFAAQRGDYTGPISSPFGWHIFRVADVREEKTKPFDAVRDVIEKDLRQTKADALLSETVERLEDALASGAALEEAARADALPYAATGPVTRAGAKEDGGEALAPKRFGALLQTAFALAPQARSDLVSEADGAFYVVEVESVVAPRARSFKEARGMVLADWEAAEVRKIHGERAAEAARALQGATTPEGAAKALRPWGAKLFTLTVDRNGIAQKDKSSAEAESALSPALLDAVFALRAPGDASIAVPLAKGGHAAAALRAILPAPDPKEKEGKRLRQTLRRSLEETYGNEIAAQYLAALRKRFPVRIHEDALKAAMEE